MPREKYHAVMFDLLTALLDSWSLWNKVAGSEDVGFDWRKRYLQLTYNAGSYRSHWGQVGGQVFNLAILRNQLNSLAEFGGKGDR